MSRPGYNFNLCKRLQLNTLSYYFSISFEEICNYVYPWKNRWVSELMRISYIVRKVSHWASDLPVGGAWGRTVREYIQKNLRWLWFDGLFASASDNIIINFISLYILSLGASEFQIGLMSSISSFLAALMLFFWGYSCRTCWSS